MELRSICLLQESFFSLLWQDILPSARLIKELVLTIDVCVLGRRQNSGKLMPEIRIRDSFLQNWFTFLQDCSHQIQPIDQLCLKLQMIHGSRDPLWLWISSDKSLPRETRLFRPRLKNKELRLYWRNNRNKIMECLLQDKINSEVEQLRNYNSLMRYWTISKILKTWESWDNLRVNSELIIWSVICLKSTFSHKSWISRKI